MHFAAERLFPGLGFQAMFAQRFRQALLMGLVALGYGGLANAQVPVEGYKNPIGVKSGFTGQALNSLYTRDIGTGYSVSSLNSNTLQSGKASAPFIRQLAPISGGGPRLDTGIGGGGASSKPFSGYSPSPTTSPYLNLFNEGRGSNNDFAYQTLVKPQLQQQQFNQQAQQQAQNLARRLQQISAQPDYNPEGSKTQYPTGHQTVFQYHGHYYPQSAVRPKR